ncbi:trypsin-like peptidase domain-containing protein [bacterium]|nr:trypsin-like peptidase domain-containing protein [bacterium]
MNKTNPESQQIFHAFSLASFLLVILTSGCSTAGLNKTSSPSKQGLSLDSNEIIRNEPSVCTIQEYSPEELFENSKNGVAVVHSGSSVGSAFVVKHENNSTLLVTNAHVVDGRDAVTLKWANGSQDQAAVVKTGDVDSLNDDLALLQVSGTIGKVLKIKSEKVNTGADIVAIGAPRGFEFTITRGIVSAQRDDGRIIQIDAPINPGNSGGAVLDRTGCVVGVATFIRKDSEGLGFAISAGKLQEFLFNEQIASSSRPVLTNRRSPAVSNRNTDRQTSCWFQQKRKGDLVPSDCSVTSRRNSNGHLVYDVVESQGDLKRTVVLWDGSKAEVILRNNVYQGSWRTDKDGDVRVSVTGGVFAFSIPESIQDKRDLDQQADEIFYKRYPELRGRSLGSSKGRLAKEWMDIRNSLD